MSREAFSPCSLSMHYSNIVLLQRRFCCIQDPALWVSVLHENVEYLMDEWKNYLTIFVRNALPKYCAPSSSIWFHSRCSIVSACIEESYEYVIDEYRTYLTLFVSNALLKYFVPSLLILFRLRSSIVSVYHEWGWWTCNQWVDKFSHCVRLQCITQVLCCFVADIVWRKIQASDCLYWMKMCEYVMND